jgi:hypothetical protein
MQHKEKTGKSANPSSSAIANRPIANRPTANRSTPGSSKATIQPVREKPFQFVVQFNKVTSDPVVFNGGESALRDLILQWGSPGGTQVNVQQTDFVGKSYTVTFNSNKAITKADANRWVQAALSRASESKSKSKSDSSSDESASDGPAQMPAAITVLSMDGEMTDGESATPMGAGYYVVLVNGSHHRAKLLNGIYHLV